MEKTPLFKQPSKMSSFSSHCIAHNIVNCMGYHIENVTHDWKAGSATEHLNALTKWLCTVKDWWENDIIVDPCSPMHEIMKGAIVQAAAEKWKNKEIAWGALLTSHLFDSVTIDCISWSTDEPTHGVDEDLYQEVLSRVHPSALKRLKLVSNKLYAWQTSMVRDLLFHSPNITRVEVPFLTHNLLDGIARTANHLEELEIMADMNYTEYGDSHSIFQKAAQTFLGGEDCSALIRKAKKGGRVQLPFPRLTKFYIDVDYSTSSFCCAMLYFYSDIKFRSYSELAPDSSNDDDDEVYLTDYPCYIGSLIIENEEDQFSQSVINVDDFITDKYVWRVFKENQFSCRAVRPTNLIIFHDISSNYELLKDLLRIWTTVVKLSIKNIEFLEAIKDSHASQILCIELSHDTCVLKAFDVLPHFHNLKHLMFAYPVESTVYEGQNHTFDQIKELTITFRLEKCDTNPKWLQLVMTSVPSLETLHLRGVTCAMWTSGYLKYCGHASVKHATLVVTEELDACPCAWLDAFPGLDELTIKSKVPQKNRLTAKSRLNITYEGFVTPHIQ